MLVLEIITAPTLQESPSVTVRPNSGLALDPNPTTLYYLFSSWSLNKTSGSDARPSAFEGDLQPLSHTALLKTANSVTNPRAAVLTH